MLSTSLSHCQKDIEATHYAKGWAFSWGKWVSRSSTYLVLKVPTTMLYFGILLSFIKVFLPVNPFFFCIPNQTFSSYLSHTSCLTEWNWIQAKKFLPLPGSHATTHGAVLHTLLQIKIQDLQPWCALSWSMNAALFGCSSRGAVCRKVALGT